MRYFASLRNSDKIQVVSPDVGSLSNLFISGNIDYVGTRLHAGIFAMQHKIRSVILVVDNRAADMAFTYNLNTIQRDDPKLKQVINSELITDVHIDEDAIESWKCQFRS